MSMLIMIIIGITYGVLSAMLGWPFWGLIVVILLASVILIGDIFYTAYRSKNLHKIRKFIEKHKKDPVYQFMLLHAEDAPSSDKVDTLERILAKYKQDKFQATYGVHLALVQEDLEAAKRAIQPIINTDIGSYTNDIIHILNGEPLQTKQAYNQQWMNDSITAHEAFMQKDLEKFDAYVKKSLANTAGIQLFGNYYSFQQMREKLS